MTQGELIPAIEGENEIIDFQKKPIRRVMHNGERHFSVVDIIGCLVDTNRPTRYWGDLRAKLSSEGATWLTDKIGKLDMKAKDGKFYSTDGIQIEDIFRLVQSIPSPSVEPFKKRLAKVGFERIQEIQNPDLAIKKAIAIYKAKGYSDERVDARIGGILARKGLTDEWQKKKVDEEKYGVLTNAMHIETFEISPADHKKIKGLKNQPLRDNMTPIENTLVKLAEQTATEILKGKTEDDFGTVRAASVAGGKIAGTARKSIEEQTGKPVVSSTNYLTERQRKNNALADIPELDSAMKLIADIDPTDIPKE